jgi:hypothetical protein
MAGGLVLLGGVMAVFSPRFADTVVSVAATARSVRRGPRATAFRGGRGNRRCAKEFLLLRRDPVAVVAKPDATALSGAAGPDAVAKLFR